MWVLGILLTIITAAQNEVALRYHRVCGRYLMAVIFAAIIGSYLLYPYDPTIILPSSQLSSGII